MYWSKLGWFFLKMVFLIQHPLINLRILKNSRPTVKRYSSNIFSFILLLLLCLSSILCISIALTTLTMLIFFSNPRHQFHAHSPIMIGAFPKTSFVLCFVNTSIRHSTPHPFPILFVNQISFYILPG